MKELNKKTTRGKAMCKTKGSKVLVGRMCGEISVSRKNEVKVCGRVMKEGSK